MRPTAGGTFFVLSGIAKPSGNSLFSFATEGMLGLAPALVHESPPPPRDSAAAPSSGGPLLAATLTVSAEGFVTDASFEAVAWWKTKDAQALIGGPFADLFFFEAPGSGGDPMAQAWKLLEAAATARPLTLQARVEGGGFEAVVHLVPVARGSSAASTATRSPGTYTAQIERANKSVPPASVPSTGPRPARAAEAPAVKAPTPSTTPQPLKKEVAPISNATVGDDSGHETDDEDEELSDLAIDDAALLDDNDEDSATGLAEDEADDDDELNAELADSGSARDPGEEGPAGRGASWAGWRAWDGSGVGVFELNFRRGTARYSEALLSLLDYEPEDVANEPETLGALFHPEDSEAAPQSDTRGRRRSRTPLSVEARLRARDGSWRWMQLEGMQTFDADGRLEHVTGVMLDAQERHDLEDQMGRVEEQFRQLLDSGRRGFFALDLVEDKASFSPEFRHALGYSATELAATLGGFLRLLRAEDAELGAAPFFGALMDGGQGLTRRLCLRHKDGREIECEVMLGAKRNRRREVVGVVGVIASTTGSAPASDASAAALASTEARDSLAEAAHSALDAVGEAVVLTDDTGCVVHANMRAMHWAGGDPQKIHGHSFQEIFALVDRTTGVPALEVVRRVLQGGHSLELDYRYALIDAAGNRDEVVVTCRALYDVRKRVNGGIVILRKPSEMPLSPAELVASNRMETLGRLACGIAHDFNNILTTVTGSVSLALDKREWEPLAPATKALGTARNLARQLLTFARGDTTEKKVQSVNDIIKETSRLTAAGSKSSVQLQLANDAFPVNVDSVRIVQVLTNLILNAMQVMPAGGRIWVRTQNMHLGQVNSVALAAGDYVRVEVQDDGPGIPPENVEHIFEPFFSTRSGGTGLGLAMVRSILTQHEGAIEVASTVGTGSTFTFYLPRASVNPVKAVSQPMSVAFGTGRILVMDDDVDLCMVAKGMLEVLGYDADTATSAADTVATVRRFRDMGRRYSAVILDLTMAGGPGGEDVLPQLREIDPEIVAIVSSGYATDDQMERYQKMGFKGMLAKPYRSSDLGRALKEVLEAAK